MNIKKIIFVLLASILFLNTSFSYNVSNYDKSLLNKIYLKIDKFDEQKLDLLEKKIKKLVVKYKDNERLNFLLRQIDNHVLNKLNSLYKEKLNNQKSVKNIFRNTKVSKEKNNSQNEFKVLKVIDWDTIIIDYFWKRENIRFIGIDAPENSKIRKWYVECYWKEAKDYLFNLLNNKKISLEFDDTQGKKR